MSDYVLHHIGESRMPAVIRFRDQDGNEQDFTPEPRTLKRNTTLADDIAMLENPLTPGGGMNHCFGDGYYALSLEEKWGAPIEELRRRVRAGMGTGSPERRRGP